MAAQIDPLQLGREQRAIEIATDYAKRLGVLPHVFERLAEDYPSHGFVIDCEEAMDLLPEGTIRQLTKAETLLEKHLASSISYLYNPPPNIPFVYCLNSETEQNTEQSEETNHEEVQGSDPSDRAPREDLEIDAAEEQEDATLQRDSSQFQGSDREPPR